MTTTAKTTTVKPTAHIPQPAQRLVGEIEVRAGEHTFMPLGDFGQQLPRGFSIEVSPDIFNDQISAEITQHASEFILDVTNKSDTAVAVTAWQL